MQAGRGVARKSEAAGEARRALGAELAAYRDAAPTTGQLVRPSGTARARGSRRFHDHLQATSLVTTAP